jgi:uncharacterized phage protein (TIGR01671 family)
VKQIKYRQKLKDAYVSGYGDTFHYWGYIDGGFVSPVGLNVASKESEQFTGLQDKNGVDIYEGDVVSQKLNCLWDEGRHNLEVRFNHDQFQTGNVKSYSSLYSAVQSFDAEIIGNIHENKELL